MQPQVYSASEFPPRIILCVGAIVVNKDKVLFVRQAEGGEKNNWSIPWGFVDGNTPDGTLEPPDVAAIRETQEETGIIAEVEGLLGVQNHSNRQGKLRVYLLYLCRHISGEPTPDNQETDKAAYLSLAEIETLNEPVLEFCKWIARRVLCGEHHLIPPMPMNPYHPHLAFL